jgi:hypothetical protein
VYGKIRVETLGHGELKVVVEAVVVRVFVGFFRPLLVFGL